MEVRGLSGGLARGRHFSTLDIGALLFVRARMSEDTTKAYYSESQNARRVLIFQTQIYTDLRRF